MNPGDLVRIEYIRPGKKTTYYEEEFVSQDETCLRTYKALPLDIVKQLNSSLKKQNLIADHQSAVTIAKTYFFAEPFNILEFRDEKGLLLGYYSDIGEPMLKMGPGQFQMTDLYLDIWLYPDGRLVELDWDEFKEAIYKQVITTVQADSARATMERLVSEGLQGIYPKRYL